MVKSLNKVDFSPYDFTPQEVVSPSQKNSHLQLVPELVEQFEPGYDTQIPNLDMYDDQSSTGRHTYSGHHHIDAVTAHGADRDWARGANDAGRTAIARLMGYEY